MKTLLSLAGAAAVAVALSLLIATPSLADPHGDAVGAGIVGGVLGFMAGAAVASGPHHYVEYNDESYYDHVRACRHAYRWRYDPESDLVTDRYGNEYPCDL